MPQPYYKPPRPHRPDAGKAKREAGRFFQLLTSLLLLALVLLGHSSPTGLLAQWKEHICTLVTWNTDFRTLGTRLEASLAEGDAWEETLSIACLGLCKDIQSPPEPTQETPPAEVSSQPIAAPPLLSSDETPAEASARAEISEDVPSPDPVPTQNTGMSDTQILDEGVTPVMGVVSSGFGYRIHPIDGEWKPHRGLDIAAPVGTEILSFASGVVDYVGESEADYGLYLQIDHGSGVCSFYAHCSEILVKAGQPVQKGDLIARVGDTGYTTGAHLHLELKQNGERIDPAPYIQEQNP